MDVTIKDFGIDMQVKNRGIELAIYDTKARGNKFLGDLVVTKSGLTWCKGKTDRVSGKKIAWSTFIELMNKN